MAAATEMGSIDAFLSHKSGMGGGTKRVSKWKEDGKIDVFLHTRRMPVAIYNHGFPHIVTLKDKDTQEPVNHAWTQKFICHEEEAVLKDQYRITDGKPDNPAQVCGICRTVAMIRYLVFTGKIGWLDPVFYYEGDDKSEAIQLRAAGLYGGFDTKKTNDAQKAEMKKAKVWVKDAWKQNAMAKGNYVLTVVECAKPSEGIVVMTEAALLGDKIKEAIAAMRVQQGDKEGNPILNPYAFRLFYREAEEQFDKKYAAIGLPSVKPNDEVLKMLRSDPPNIDNVTTPFNQTKMRLSMEKHWVHDFKLPWDKLFPETTKPSAANVDEDAPEGFGAEKPKAESRPHEVQGPAKKEAEPDFGCDDCDAPMFATETVCKNCGKTYDVTPESPPPPPPPKLPSRSSLGKGASMASAASKASEEPRATSGGQKSLPGQDPAPEIGDDQDVPF